MEALFITMMALVVLLTGFVSAVVLWKLFKADNNSGHQADHI
jgi:heme/copper-type cytochrome/quinol oxidase subunit 2